jgi:hypothetical protein
MEHTIRQPSLSVFLVYVVKKTYLLSSDVRDV